MRTLYRLGDRGAFLIEEFPWQGKRKTNGHTEKGGKETFPRNLGEGEETYPYFKEEFGHWEGDRICGQRISSATVTLVENVLESFRTYLVWIGKEDSKTPGLCKNIWNLILKSNAYQVAYQVQTG